MVKSKSDGTISMHFWLHLDLVGFTFTLLIKPPPYGNSAIRPFVCPAARLPRL